MSDDDNSSYEKINLLTLGNSAVGKTCLTVRFCKGEFSNIYLTTIGLNFIFKYITLPNKKKIKICFYDTAGQERYNCISKNQINSSNGILLMYDITSTKTFDAIPEWIKSILDVKGENFPMILIGNKSDKEEERQVQKEEGEKEAQKNNLSFYETSNKDGSNVEEAINDLIKKVLESDYYKNEKIIRLNTKKIKKDVVKFNIIIN